MNAPLAHGAAVPLMLTELRLPTIKRLWAAGSAVQPRGLAGRALAAHAAGPRDGRARDAAPGAARADSQLPPGKSVAEFDFAAVPTVSKAHVMALAEADSWIGQGHNLLAFGPPGTGKTHLVAGIGHALIDRGLKVLFMRTSELVQRLQAGPRATCGCRPNWPSSIASTWSSWTTSATPDATRPRPRCCSN